MNKRQAKNPRIEKALAAPDEGTRGHKKSAHLVRGRKPKKKR